MTKPHLTSTDLEEAARDYGVDLDPNLLAAVVAVESGGKGFWSDGRPKMLFEGHIFYKQLQRHEVSLTQDLLRNFPSIIYRKWTRAHYIGGPREYERLAVAVTIHPEAALESASWGMFQLMGFNYRAAGFRDVKTLVHAHYQSERQHLRAIVRWMKGNGLLKKLAAKDWEGFTRGYNGPGQVEYYANKLRRAYEVRL